MLNVELALFFVRLRCVVLHVVAGSLIKLELNLIGEERSQKSWIARRRLYNGVQVERKSVVEISAEQVWERENIEHSETGANRRPAITPRIPGEALPGSKIAQRGILDHGLAV